MKAPASRPDICDAILLLDLALAHPRGKRRGHVSETVLRHNTLAEPNGQECPVFLRKLCCLEVLGKLPRTTATPNGAVEDPSTGVGLLPT